MNYASRRAANSLGFGISYNHRVFAVPDDEGLLSSVLPTHVSLIQAARHLFGAPLLAYDRRCDWPQKTATPSNHPPPIIAPETRQSRLDRPVVAGCPSPPCPLTRC
jgi:hypothetical protein